MRKLLIMGGMVILLSLIVVPLARGETEVEVIDTPTAKVLAKNQYDLNFRFYQGGGLLVNGKAGLTEDLTIGASYGGEGMIGEGEFKGNPEPTFSLKYKLAEEGEEMPISLAAGYNGQGYGRYYREGDKIKTDLGTKTVKDNYNFYQTNSLGFFLSASKNLDRFYLHGGINYSLENDPGKSNISFFLAADVQLTPQIVAKLEYNDLFHGQIKYSEIFEHGSSDQIYRKSGGELNIGFKWQYTPDLSLELDFRDLTQCYPSSSNRIFQINYCGKF